MAKIFANCVFTQARKFLRVLDIIIKQKTGTTPSYGIKLPCLFLDYRE